MDKTIIDPPKESNGRCSTSDEMGYDELVETKELVTYKLANDQNDLSSDDASCCEVPAKDMLSLEEQLAHSESERTMMATELSALKLRCTLQNDQLNQMDCAIAGLEEQLRIMKAVNKNANDAIDIIRRERQALIQDLIAHEETISTIIAELNITKTDCLKKDKEISDVQNVCTIYKEWLHLEQRDRCKLMLKKQQLEKELTLLREKVDISWKQVFINLIPSNTLPILILMVGFMIGGIIFSKMI